MTRLRSPNYPSLPLEEAIDFVRKIYSKSRANPIDREAAAKDMGYSGISGRSAQILGTLAQYALTERTGKEGLRVSAVAVDILHPADEPSRRQALNVAAFSPSLFAELRQRFSDGVPSENAIRSYLMREGYADSAVSSAISSFLETYRYLQQENALDQRSGPSGITLPTIAPQTEDARGDIPREGNGPPQLAGPRVNVVVGQIEGERVVFTEESKPFHYVKIVVNGEFDEVLLEVLENYVQRQKKRLNIKS